MSDSENFVSRWSRLKRAPDAAPEATPPAGLEAPGTLEGADEVSPALLEAQPVGENEPEFDPASLPAVESIDIDTDIRGFLQPRVPPELTRAALRRAWASDPAIRDFIGIAENQWDFNDPTSIFGFGPMRATDNVPALLAQAMGRLEDVAETVMAATDPLAVAKPDDAANGTDMPAMQIAAAAGADPVTVTLAAADDPIAVADDEPRRPRQHGGALPQ
ncbi:DUF3306 domain-containing protein [soil metagenome]